MKLASSEVCMEARGASLLSNGVKKEGNRNWS